MKKILIIMALLLLAGCSSIKTKDEYKKGITLSSMDDVPSVAELVELKEGVEAIITLDGNRILVTTLEDNSEEIEIPITFETMDIDGTLSVDMSMFYSDSSKLSKVDYVFNNDETIMAITDESKEEVVTFEVPINVYYPSYTIADNIEIDTYIGYDINDFVSADQGVDISSEIDEENSLLNITLSKNEWTKIESVEVTLTSSEPQYPRKYLFVKQVDEAGYVNTRGAGVTYHVFTSENEGYTSHLYGPITFKCEGEYMYITEGPRTWKTIYWFDGDYLNYKYDIPGYEKFGTYTFILEDKYEG